MTTEKIDLRKIPGDEAIRAEEISRRRSHLVGVGFSEQWVDSLLVQRPTLYDPVVVDRHIAGLTERGFTNPKKMIESLPAILGHAFENIDAKVTGLTERGFTNPKKMIESLPAILGLAFENIDAKVTGLTERGFTNPKKMIESLSAILGYAFENIDRRMGMFKRLNSHYGLGLDVVGLMEKNSSMFSTKPDKMWVLVRVMGQLDIGAEEVEGRHLGALLKSNLEDVLVALKETGAGVSFEEFMKSVRTTGEQRKGLTKKMTKDEKAAFVQERKQMIAIELDGFDKIKRRYFRGYPEAA